MKSEKKAEAEKKEAAWEEWYRLHKEAEKPAEDKPAKRACWILEDKDGQWDAGGWRTEDPGMEAAWDSWVEVSKTLETPWCPDDPPKPSEASETPSPGVGVVPGSRATPTPAPPAPDAVPGSRAASGSGGPDGPPKWPMVPCSTPLCDTIAHGLKKMLSEKVITNVQKTMSDPDDEWHWVYKCVKCIMVEEGCSQVEAWATIHENLPNPKWARNRTVKYMTAWNNKDKECEGMSRKGKRKLALDDIAELLKPLADHVCRKLQQLAARHKGVAEYDKLLSELRACRNKEREIELIEKLEEWDKKLAELCKPLAFADRHKGVAEYDKLLSELRACRNKEREIELIDALEEWDKKLAELCKPLAFAGRIRALQSTTTCCPTSRHAHVRKARSSSLRPLRNGTRKASWCRKKCSMWPSTVTNG